jgi:RNA polymerase sigma factor (sigma-70 family)
MTDHDDDQLADAVQSGDLAAQEEFFTRFQVTLIKVARRRGFQPADADDLAQETLVQGFLTIGSFRRGEPLKQWLVGILWNMMRRKWEERKEAYVVTLDDVTENKKMVWRLDEPTSAEEKKELGRLHAEAELLMVIAYKDPEKRRYMDAVRLRLDGLEYADIEAAMHLSKGSGKVYVWRGVRILKELHEMPAPLDTPRSSDA